MDPQVVFVQYATQVVYSAFQLYGIEIPNEAQEMYYEIYQLDPVWTQNTTQRTHVRAEAGYLFTAIAQEILNDAFTGILWLLPVAVSTARV